MILKRCLSRAGLTLFAGCAVLCLSACASAQSVQVPAASQDSAGVQSNVSAAIAGNATAAPTQEPLAARVNGQPITLAALNKEVARHLDGIRAVGDPMPTDMNAERDSRLNVLIDQALIEQAAAIQKITVTDAEVDAEIQQDIQVAGGKDKWTAWLTANDLTETENRDRIRSTLITNKMRDIVIAGIGNTAEEVHARQILVSSLDTANEVLSKLKAGADFASLAAQYSLDTSTRQTGGDLGWFARGELLEPTVEDAAFSLQPNQISGPVQSKLGYHIVQTLERVNDRPISSETRFKLEQNAFDSWLQSLEKNAKIEKYLSGSSS